MSKPTYNELEQELAELKKGYTGSLKEREHELLFDSMTEMIEIIELIYNKNDEPIDFYIRDINLAFSIFLGKPKEELINKKTTAIITVIANTWLLAFAGVDKTRTEISFENYGAEFDKHYVVKAWKVSQNRVGVSYTDVSKIKKAEIELQKRNTELEVLLDTLSKTNTRKALIIADKERLELVMGSLNECVWGRSLPDSKMHYVSDSVVSLYGFPMLDWYEDSNLWFDLIHPDDLKRVNIENKSLFITGSSEIKYRIITAEKKTKWIQSKTQIIKNTDGIPYFMTGIARFFRAENAIRIKGTGLG